MRLLVTGAAGFIGSNFVHRTLETRPDVSVTVLDSLTYAGRISNLDGALNKIEFVNGDIRNAALVDALVAKADQVVHFAAESHNDNSLFDPKAFIETNVLGTYELLQACVRHNVRLHHVSTDEVFGDLEFASESKFNRATPYNPSSPYSASKASSDHLVRAWVRSFGLLATISNCSNNYGLRQHEEKLIPRTILLAASGIKPKIYGLGANVRDWIHVDDHCDGIWSVIDRGQLGETYLLGSNCERTNLQVVKSVLGVLGLDQNFIEYVPDRPGHDKRYAIDASATYSELGWVPRKPVLEESLPQLVEYYLGQLHAGKIDISSLSNAGLSTRL